MSTSNLLFIDIMGWAVLLFLTGMACVFTFSCIRIVQQQTRQVVQSFGRFSRVLSPGFNLILWPIEQVAGTVSLKIDSVPSVVDVKTKDNMFVALPINLMIHVDADKAFDAFYKLRVPRDQIKAWVLNTVRSTAASMTLEELFNDRSQIINGVREALVGKLSEFGYLVESVLVDQPTVPEEVQRAFNSVVASQREREAAEQQGEAAKIRITKQAEAEAEAQRLRAKGLADSRKTIAEGLRASLAEFSGIDQREAVWVLVETNRIDAIREAAKHNNLVLMDLGRQATSHEALLPLLGKHVGEKVGATTGGAAAA